jgi:hypothetical protein
MRSAWSQKAQITGTGQTAAPTHANVLNTVSQAASGDQTVDPAGAKPGSDYAGAETPRTLVLIDTSPGQNARDGTARLSTDPRNPQTYVTGALLLNGARLTEIHRDYVVLERGADSTRLYVQGKAPRDSVQKSPLILVGGVSPPASSSTSDASTPSSEDARTAAITTYIRPNPVFEREQLHGFALYPGVQSAEFSKLGLQAGDVITAINGVGVTSGQEIMDALEQLTAGASVAATIQRGGKVQQVTLDGSVITAEHRDIALAGVTLN